ncbi:DUF4315 family protein [Lachnospiraceae bacterium MD308]|nr:DUF4315 family protein [Lachnospiraceae bacterium MD308]
MTTNRKLYRVLDEIQKTEKKIAVWQEHLSKLNEQREMLENAEIIKSVRSMKLGSRELLSVLEGVQNGTIVLSENYKTEEGFETDESVEFMNLTDGTDNGTAEWNEENKMSEGLALESEDFNSEGEN